MENKQLGIMLYHISKRLINGIVKASSSLPDNIERRKQNHYIGDSKMPNLDHKNCEMRETGIPTALDEIAALVDELQAQSESLMEPKSS